jgi:hypothetical protein
MARLCANEEVAADRASKLANPAYRIIAVIVAPVCRMSLAALCALRDASGMRRKMSLGCEVGHTRKK